MKDRKKQLKRIRREKKLVMFFKFISFILIIMSVITAGLMIYKEMLTVYEMVPVIIVGVILIFIFSLILNSRLRIWVKTLFTILALFVIVLEGLFLILGNDMIDFLNDIHDTGFRIEEYGVYVLEGSEVTTLNDLKDKRISYLSQEDDSKIRNAITKLEEKITFEVDFEDGLDELLEALADETTDAIFMETSYAAIVEEEYNIDIRFVDKVQVVGKVDIIKSDVDIRKDPFIVYVSGVDTSGHISSSARSDVNLLVGINPKSGQVLLVSTPRDYYVTLASKNAKDKLTHAGVYGIEESVNTLNNFYDIDISYYARVNFTSFVKIVDTLGGVSVEVPQYFCEQDSTRGSETAICLNKGKQTLNGEQALAFARHRKTFNGGDRARGTNQMIILEAMFKKAMSPKMVANYSSILKALEGKVVTNMTSDEMLRFARKHASNASKWTYTSISADGEGSTESCFAAGGGYAYVMLPDDTSVNNIKLAFDNLFEGKTNLKEGFIEEEEE